jgi:transposase
MSEKELTARLYPVSPWKKRKRAQPDWARIHRELRRPHVTLQLLWQEYKLDHPDGYQYSQFCERYRRFQEQVDPVLRQRYRAGEKLFVDYAGPTIEVIDPQNGEVRASRSSIRRTEKSVQLRSLSQSWAPATTRMRKPPGSKTWRVGSELTCAASSFSVAFPGS